MHNLITEIIGYTAAAIGTVLMLPQVIKSARSHRVDDISNVMVVIYVVNCILWLAYGLLLKAGPLIVCNAVALVIGFFQWYLKIKYTTRLR